MARYEGGTETPYLGYYLVMMLGPSNYRFSIDNSEPLEHYASNRTPIRMKRGGGLGVEDSSQRVRVPNNSVLGFWAIVIVVQVSGKYMIFRYLDP